MLLREEKKEKKICVPSKDNALVLTELKNKIMSEVWTDGILLQQVVHNFRKLLQQSLNHNGGHLEHVIFQK